MAEREDRPFDASHYDREYFEGHLLRYRGPVYAQRVRNVKRFLGGLEGVRGRRVLDLGCGVGFFSELCRGAGAEVVSMDFSREALAFCRSEYGTRLTLVNGDGTALPFRSERFDWVLMNDILEHLTPAMGRAMLEETGRVLKQGGRFVLDTDNERYLMNRPGFRRLNAFLQRGTPQQKALDAIKKTNRAPSLHVKIYDFYELERLFRELGFRIEAYDTYPYIAVPIRDALFNLPGLKRLFRAVKGDFQIYRCVKT